jgi:hypothetical protein
MFSTPFNKNAPSESLNFTDWPGACQRLPRLRLRVPRPAVRTALVRNSLRTGLIIDRAVTLSGYPGPQLSFVGSSGNAQQQYPDGL